jgi:TolB-like protein
MQRVGVAPAQSSLDAKMSWPLPTGIAVLPFENLSADPNNAFFADGVQDEILNDLEMFRPQFSKPRSRQGCLYSF